jgi:hypothetical protein
MPVRPFPDGANRRDSLPFPYTSFDPEMTAGGEIAKFINHFKPGILALVVHGREVNEIGHALLF